MRHNTTGTRRTSFPLLWHRRVGLTSFACLLLGTIWVSSVVMPGLQRSSGKKEGKLTITGADMLNLGSFLGSKPALPDEVAVGNAPLPNSNAVAPAIGTSEIALVNAPIGSALQLLLGSARFSCSTDPGVTGVVTYSCAGSPKPFWEVLGRVIGASPAPGVHVAAIWDSYRVLPRDVNPSRMREYHPVPAAEPTPVPYAEGRVTHRMVGYVSLKPSDDQPSSRTALLEMRIPGVAPQLRMVRVGDSLRRKSSLDSARETDAAKNVDIAVAVTEVTSQYVTLRGGGDKTLHIPLSEIGVADIFGFTPDTSSGKEDVTPMEGASRSAGGYNR